MSGDEDYERLAYTQRLKAAVLYTVGQICEEEEADEDVMFNRQFIITLSEATFKYSQTLARDLNLFARHAKRTTITGDDVKLAVRKNRTLLSHLQDLSEEYEAAMEEKKAKRKKGKGKTTKSTSAINEDEDSNLA